MSAARQGLRRGIGQDLKVARDHHGGGRARRLACCFRETFSGPRATRHHGQAALAAGARLHLINTSAPAGEVAGPILPTGSRCPADGIALGLRVSSKLRSAVARTSHHRHGGIASPSTFHTPRRRDLFGVAARSPGWIAIKCAHTYTTRAHDLGHRHDRRLRRSANPPCP